MLYRLFLIPLGLSLLSTASFASQNGMFNVGVLYEGMDYKRLYNQSTLITPDSEFADVLHSEGILAKKPNASEDQEDQEAHVSETVFMDDSPLLLTTEEVAAPNVTSDDLDDALVLHFKKQKKRAMIKSLGRPLAQLFLELSTLGGGVALLNDMSPTGMAFGVGIAGFVIIEKIMSAMAMCSNISWYLWATPLGDPLSDLEETYARKKRFLSAPIQTKVERVFQDARKDDLTGSKKDFLAHILKLPEKSKEPKLNLAKLAELLRGYTTTDDKNILEEVSNAIMQHRVRYTQKNSASSKPKVILYIEGVPGLGKTRMIEKLAEHVMELPLVSLMVNDENFKSTSDKPRNAPQK